MTAASQLLARAGREVGAEAVWADDEAPRTPVPLPSRLATGELAYASVAAVAFAAAIPRAALDPHRIALAYRSDRALRVEGAAPPVWSPYSGFWRTADGWLRTHGNYPHHAARLRAGLLLAESADARIVGEAIAELTTVDALSAITATGGLAVAVLPENGATDTALRGNPLLDVRQVGAASARRRPTEPSSDQPLTGFRVLDLTRVIAGPVCTRTLALLGADVLRIDPPHLPEPAWQHYDTGHGKRSSLLDARTVRMRELLAQADVVVLGYRPAALRRLGLDPESLVERHPHLVVAQLSAWGTDAPDRAGFDSLVQAESGIAIVESPDGDRPGALPAQALDHSAGYLLAAAVVTLLERREREGGGWLVRTSLRRVAAELLGMPRRREPDPEADIDQAPHTAVFRIGSTEVVTARPALPGLEFSAPHGWGVDQPRW